MSISNENNEINEEFSIESFEGFDDDDEESFDDSMLDEDENESEASDVDIDLDNINFDDFESDENEEEETEASDSDVEPDDLSEDTSEDADPFQSNFEMHDDSELKDNTEASDAYDYTDGSVVDYDLTEDEDEDSNDIESDVADRPLLGSAISVQDADDSDERGFSLIYLNIENIALTSHRIRSKRSVESLVQSIRSTGLLEPIVVAKTMTEGLYVLLSGYRRLLACAMLGKTRIPCLVNNKITTNSIPIIEAMYNHNQKYTISEQIDYINYLKTEQGIMNAAMIEFLLQMNNGDYNKLEDILSDNDDDIVSKLLDGTYDISTAYRKLEQRRKKESAEEKENKRAAQVYSDEAESGADALHGSGEGLEGSDGPSEEIINMLNRNGEELDNYLEDKDLGSMVQDDNNLQGFQPHVQKVNEREFIDPTIKKAVMARDKCTCQCCRSGGPSYVDTLDYHHVLPVFLGGNDSPDNAVMLCLSCHKLVHLYSTGDLNIEKDLLKSSYEDLSEQQKADFVARVKGDDNTDEQNKALFRAEQNKMKRIVYYGGIIRKGIAEKGISKEKYKKEHPNTRVGRRMPGKTQQEVN